MFLCLFDCLQVNIRKLKIKPNQKVPSLIQFHVFVLLYFIGLGDGTTSYFTQLHSTGSAVGQGLGFGIHTLPTTSAVEWGYFANSPWGRIPNYRKGDLLDDMMLSWPGGLLGGSSSQKSSKLAALARKRKEKAQAAVAPVEGGTRYEQKTSVSLLSRLSQKHSAILKNDSETPKPPEPPEEIQQIEDDNNTLRVHGQISYQAEAINRDLDQPVVEDQSTSVAVLPVLVKKELVASPSSFAKSIFGQRIAARSEFNVADERIFFIPGNNTKAKSKNAFSGPSPDDVVVAAQSASKGLWSICNVLGSCSNWDRAGQEHQ
jgi:elongation factor 1 alpha-like protein